MLYVDIHTHRAAPADPAAGVTIVNVRLGVDLAVPTGPFTVGLHPWDVDVVPDVLPQLESLLALPSCVGIGECGLDTRIAVPMDRQERALTEQVALSERWQLPMVLHVVRAHDRILALHGRLAPRQPWIVHGMARPAALAVRLAEAGLYLSYGAALLRDGGVARAALRATPLERFLLETDEAPTTITEVYDAAAEVLGMTVYDVAAQVETNARAVFGEGIGPTRGRPPML